MNTFLGWRMVAFAIAIDFFAVGFAFSDLSVDPTIFEKSSIYPDSSQLFTIPIFMVCSAVFQ